MRPYGTTKRTRAIVTLLAAAAVFSGSVFVERTAVGATDSIQPDDPDSGYVLPPLSDHILLARLHEEQVALRSDNGQEALEAHDGTAKQYNRGYYREPVEIGQLVLVTVPSTLEETEAINVSDDGTAQQFDRGYYKEPAIVALIAIPSETSAEYTAAQTREPRPALRSERMDQQR